MSNLKLFESKQVRSVFSEREEKWYFSITDVAVAKNYLQKEELESLGKIVNAFLDLAENRAQRKIPMTMQDWATRIDQFLAFDEREILHDGGTISAEIAKVHAESEFEKYRIIQDQLFESDFDREIKKLK